MAVHVHDQGDGGFRVEVGDLVFHMGDQERHPDGPRSADLLLAAIATCTAGTMRAFAKVAGLTALRAVDVVADATSASKPQRLQRIDLRIVIQGDLTEAQVSQLVRAGTHCKIHNTLHREPEVTIEVTREVTAGTVLHGGPTA